MATESFEGDGPDRALSADVAWSFDAAELDRSEAYDTLLDAAVAGDIDQLVATIREHQLSQDERALTFLEHGRRQRVYDLASGMEDRLAKAIIRWDEDGFAEDSEVAKTVRQALTANHSLQSEATRLVAQTELMKDPGIRRAIKRYSKNTVFGRLKRAVGNKYQAAEEIKTIMETAYGFQPPTLTESDLDRLRAGK